MLGIRSVVAHTAESLAREVERLHRSGRSDDAFTLAVECAQRFPRSALALTNAGYFYVLRGEGARAAEFYEAALRIVPDNQEARRGLAVAKTQLGVVTHGNSIARMPFRGEGRALEVLVIVTLGSGNVVTEGLFDDRAVCVTKLAVELHPPEAPLPAHDLIFNAVGDADSAPAALARVRELVARSDRAVLNAPQHVERTGRVEQAQRLASVEGVRSARIERFTRASARELRFPALVRAAGFHAGAHFVRVETAAALDAALATMPDERLLAIEPLDLREDDGTYVKYRVMIVDGALYPLHLAISRDWKVHYFSALMAEHAPYREREARFLDDPRTALGTSAWEALQRVAAATALDYAGIDFGLDDLGNVVVFETNATMAVRYPPDEPMWRYRRPAVDAILDAVTAMLRRYSSI